MTDSSSSMLRPVISKNTSSSWRSSRRTWVMSTPDVTKARTTVAVWRGSTSMTQVGAVASHAVDDGEVTQDARRPVGGVRGHEQAGAAAEILDGGLGDDASVGDDGHPVADLLHLGHAGGWTG